MLSSLSLLLAVTTTMQATATPSPRPRAHRRPPVAAVAPLVAPLAELDAAAMQLDLQLQMAQPDFASAQAPVLAMSAEAIAAVAAMPEFTGLSGLSGLAGLADVGDLTFDDEEEPELRWPQDEASTQADVADSVYRAARQALNRNDYDQAARLFRSIRDRYPKSTYVPNTYYWEAFALYRAGSDDNLRAAREALQIQASRYPKASTRRDAEVLLRRVRGALARGGDSHAAEDLERDLDSIEPGQPAPPQPVQPPQGRGPRPGRVHVGRDDCDDDDDLRIAALNAVLQMDPDRAVPLLKTVLARRDEGSACLRRKAVFLLSQKHTDETSSLLLNAVRSDPDREVR